MAPGVLGRAGIANGGPPPTLRLTRIVRIFAAVKEQKNKFVDNAKSSGLTRYAKLVCVRSGYTLRTCQ